ncbi:MAG: hypothetical protein ACQESF_02820 [Nanobdellota archaeon]
MDFKRGDMMRGRLLFFTVFVLFVSVFSVYGLDTRVNISMDEVVYNNITYAKDFDLVEENTFCEIHGTMNITNPSDETVFDTYVSFKNIERMITDFVWVDGRDGSMFSGGSFQNLTVEKDIGDSHNNYTMPIDMDNDGSTDYAWVNSTHFNFNLSSEADLISISLGVDISSGLPKTIDVDQALVTGKKDYGNLTILGDAIEANTLNVSSVTTKIIEFYESPVIIHIPELRAGNYSTYKYNVTCGENTEPPVDLVTNYTSNSSAYPNINRKVLAGYNWTVTQEARNNLYLGENVTNVNITISAQSVEWNTTSFNFSLEKLLKSGDWNNVEGNGTSNREWWWAPNGGELAPNENHNISYVVRAPYSVPFTATYLALLENISYNAPFLMSNLTIIDINASAKLNKSFEKRIYKPSDNEDNHNVTWEIRPEALVPINASYELNKVSLWVTHNMNPNNYTGLNITYENSGSPLKEVNYSTDRKWSTEIDSTKDHWRFNYTDGSNTSNPPPIVWMKPEWLITNDYAQLMNYSRTVSGEDVYLKYIYVIHGYWLQVNKNITSVGEGRYKVYTYAENIGNGWTPENEYVTVYDYVPDEFDAYNFTKTSKLRNITVGTPDSMRYGKSYRWNIPWKGTMNSSLGPKNGPNAASKGNYSWNVTYFVNGTGDYKVSELYIVGLDPLKVEGASASPVISVISGLQSHSREAIYVGIVAFLIALNVTNVVMTNRINKKIDSTHENNREK